MSLNAQGYFNALRSYLNTAEYEVTDTDAGRIVLKEKVFVGGSAKPVEYKVRLGVTGEALVINLDKKGRNGNSEPLFRFLNDNAKPWSKRCDFVVFHRVRERINVQCFEFKSATLPDALVDQLEASEAWCRALHSTIEHYTGEKKTLHLTKFVLSCHPNPAPYLDAAGKYLQRDHSIRHYLYQDIDGLALDALDNTCIESIT
ncbi:MAG TPA: hypothetical protein VMI94_01880 [Bryobacteraceae bacterium]|nr:hypothetical protein [Bryobacteraceae bacterium]